MHSSLNSRYLENHTYKITSNNVGTEDCMLLLLSAVGSVRSVQYLQLFVHHPGHLSSHRLQFVLNGSNTCSLGPPTLQVVQVGEQLEGRARYRDNGKEGDSKSVCYPTYFCGLISVLLELNLQFTPFIS